LTEEELGGNPLRTSLTRDAMDLSRDYEMDETQHTACLQKKAVQKNLRQIIPIFEIKFLFQ